MSKAQPLMRHDPVDMVRRAPVRLVGLHPNETVDYFRKKYEPYRVLWLRVFIRAAWDYAQYKDAKKIGLLRYAESAERWLFASSTLINSFEMVFESLGLPVEPLRNIARNMTKNDVKRMEHLERDGFNENSIRYLLKVRNRNGDSR